MKIHLDSGVGADQLKNMNADIIILATGSVPTKPDVPGIDSEIVSTCLESIAHPEKTGKKVMVIGGGLVGCEIALEYAMNGKHVTVVERLPEILSAGFPSPIPNAQMIPDLLEKYGVQVLTRHGLSSIGNGKVVLKSDNGPVELEADSVVIATGFKPSPSMIGELGNVDVILVEESLAVVRVLEEGWGGRIDFTDVLLMLKMNGEWKCVAKAYNQNSNTIQK